MKHQAKPKFWERPPNHTPPEQARWYLLEYPYVCELSHDKLKYHDQITEELLKISNKDQCTWLGVRFYFKNENDAVMFKLRWT